MHGSFGRLKYGEVIPSISRDRSVKAGAFFVVSSWRQLKLARSSPAFRVSDSDIRRRLAR